MYSRVPIIVRFSASLPDIPITVDEPQYTSVLSLICLIRSRISAPHNVSRIRLIYSGRVLSLDTSLVEALRLQPSATTSSPPNSNDKGKGTSSPRATADRNYYIHVSFSDALDASLLEKERDDAAAADAKLVAADELELESPTEEKKRPTDVDQRDHRRKRSQLTGTRHGASSSQVPLSPASQMPQGFDRLLSAGLSALEVASLRSQFMAILAHTHTPDTMPNAYELRELEEQWLDNDAEGVSGGSGGAQATGQAGGTGGLFGRLGGNVADEDSSGLDDMLWGNLIGFFWPIGSVVWLMREEGVWTQRRKIAVVTGALVNLAFSIMRAAS